MTHELAKTYEPQNVEDRIYRSWIEGGYFHAKVDPSKKPYTIVIPPPTSTRQRCLSRPSRVPTTAGVT